MRPWYDPQATIGLILFPQCQPDAHQVFIIKGPVATILVPQGHAAESRLLSHDAIMVTLGYGQVFLGLQETSEYALHFRIKRPKPERLVPGKCLQ